MRKHNNAQVALEYILVISFVMICFTIFLYIIAEYRLTKTDEQTQILIGELTNTIQNEIILAESVHSGYHRTFYLPTEISGDKEYTITNTNTSVDIRIKTYYASIRIPPINGTINKGYNHIIKTEEGITII